jgi:excinuclease UvrABC helicase subunit UvrB
MVVFAPVVASPADRPPTPTPRPGTLGARAQTITLNRSALEGDRERVVLDNDAIARIGKNTSLTLGAIEPAKESRSQPAASTTTSERARWRAAHRKQSRVIIELERRRALLEIEVDHLENQRLTIKTMARIQNAEAKLRMLDREIAVERAELARIVREARRRGAEPGWFR